MKLPCGAILTSVAVSWGAAAPASYADDAPPTLGPFELTMQMDLDALIGLADGEGVDESPHADFRVRTMAEAVTDRGVRWGGALNIAARTRDGRRGLQARGAPLGGLAGLVTGLGGDGEDGDPAAGLDRAELFVKTSLFELFAGHGETAAARDRLTAPSALRLTGADGALIDPLGTGLVHTGLSLTQPAATVTVRTRRLAGFAASASYTPQGDSCGVSVCRNTAYGHVDSVVSAALGFDRRSRGSGVRWRVQAGAELGQAMPGPLSGVLEDPWLVSVQGAREADGVTVSVNAAHVREGALDSEYSAISAGVAKEAGDWFLDAQAGWAHSDIAQRTGWTTQIGASRFVGRRGLAGAAIQLQQDGGAALLAEAGLRF